LPCTPGKEIPTQSWSFLYPAYEFWTGDAGTRMVTYFVCVANGFALFPDGRKVAFKDHIALNSTNQTILVKKETLDGAVYD